MTIIIRQDQTLVDIVHRQVEKHPAKVAFEFLLNGEDQQINLTYSELDQHARSIGAMLQALHLTGERVLLIFPPGLDFITAFFGCHYAGAVAVPTYPPDVSRLERSMPRFMAIVNSSQPKAVLTTSPILGMSQFFLAQFPEMQALKWLAVESLYSEESLANEWIYPSINADSLAFLQYTSGSTAEPKGVMVTNANLLHQLEMITQAFHIDLNQDRAVFWLPFYHDMGLIGGILGSLYTGGTNTLMSPLDFLQRPLRWLQALTRTKATISGGPNFAYEMCIRKITQAHKETLDLSNWSLAFNGAEPIRAETMERFAEAFTPCGFQIKSFYPCYGLAEATLLVTGGDRFQPPIYLDLDTESLSRNEVIFAATEQTERTRLVGCGHTWNDQRIIIVDPDSLSVCEENEKGATGVGEIWVTGDSIAQGYWKLPNESQLTFQAQINGSDRRFLRTGDLGFLFKGELFVTGRMKDLIIIDGLNHYPQDIELTVEKCHPAIRQGCSAAFSIESGGQEQLVIVAEVARPEQLGQITVQQNVDTQPDAIIQAIRAAVSIEQDLKVAQIILLKSGSIPKTSSGKIQRHACKQGYLNNTLETWI